MIDPRLHLRALAEAAMPGAFVSVPREWVLAILGESEPADMVEVDLTIVGVAELFKKAPSTIRGWCEDGSLDAYKDRSGAWRITRLAVREYQERERGRYRQQTSSSASARTSAMTGSLSDWRHTP